MEIFAKRLKELREEKGLSQNMLANKTGLSDTAINQWEKGTTMPLLDSLITLAKFFGVSIDYLAGLVDE